MTLVQSMATTLPLRWQQVAQQTGCRMVNACHSRTGNSLIKQQLFPSKDSSNTALASASLFCSIIPADVCYALTDCRHLLL